MRIKTMRFGEIEVAEDTVLTFPWGLPGFFEQKRFVPIEYREGSALFFLQAVDQPELTFIIADPFYFLGDKYVVDIPPEDLKALELSSPKDAVVYVILTLRGEGKQISANLLAPLVINTAKRIGRQVILANSPYEARFPLTKQGELEKAAQAE